MTGASQRVECHWSENEKTIQLEEPQRAVGLPTMQLSEGALVRNQKTELCNNFLGLKPEHR
jgi:hypothetical protein